MIAGSLVEGIWDGLFGKEGLFVQLYDVLFGGTDNLLLALHGALFGGNGKPLEDILTADYEDLFGRGAGLGPNPKHQSSSGSSHGGGGGGFGYGSGGGIPEIPKRGAGFGGGMSTEGYEGNTGGVHITQNIYSQAMSAADIMEEALFRQREAILFGV